MEIGRNEWGSLHRYRLDSETRSRSVVNGSTAAVDRLLRRMHRRRSLLPAGMGIFPMTCETGAQSVMPSLRVRSVGKDASLRDIALEIGQRIRAILIEFALNVIFHPSPHALS